jgi:hypothetical protein
MGNALSTFLIHPVLNSCIRKIQARRMKKKEVAPGRTPEERQRDRYRDRARDAARELVSVAFVAAIGFLVWHYTFQNNRSWTASLGFLAALISIYAILRHLVYMVVFVWRGRGFF